MIIHSFLVGESFMKQARPDHAFTALFGQPEGIYNPQFEIP